MIRIYDNEDIIMLAIVKMLLLTFLTELKEILFHGPFILNFVYGGVTQEAHKLCLE